MKKKYQLLILVFLSSFSFASFAQEESNPSIPNADEYKARPYIGVQAGSVGAGPFIYVGQMENGLIRTNSDVLIQGKKYSLVTYYQGYAVNLTGSLEDNYGTITIVGNDIDLGRPLTADECKYMRKIVG